MKIILCLFSIACLYANAQESSRGTKINWEGSLTWNQILDRAKVEKKYIFVDCYTSWCMPCRRMDQEVYSDQIVAKFINENFISVKIQMDTSRRDDAKVIKWYHTACQIRSEFSVNEYPTLLFLSPKGHLVHKSVGFKDVNSMLSLVNDAVNPQMQFFTSLGHYNADIQDSASMKNMALTALSLGYKDTARRIAKDYFKKYIFSDEKKNIILTKEDVRFIATFMRSTKDQGFTFLFKRPGQINSIVGNSYFEQAFFHSIIYRDEVIPVVSLWIKTSNVAPKWDTLYKKLKYKYGHYYAKRVILDAKSRWFAYTRDFTTFGKVTAEFLRKFHRHISDDDINERAMSIFEKSSNVSQLKLAKKSIMKAIKNNSDSTNLLPNMIDTYANISYKLGYILKKESLKNKGIEVEEKVVAMSAKNMTYKENQFVKILEQMKAGIPTW
jgi:thioredoxin-related protein